jgi:hypothetical protein
MTEICRRLIDGESLLHICRTAGMPTEGTVRLWVRLDRDGCAAQYTQARELGYERLADQLLEIADDGTNDWIDRDGERVWDRDHVMRSRLRVDTRKWMLSKMLPKVYGDRTQLVGDGGGAVLVRVIIDDATARDDDFQATADDSDARAES